MAYQKKVSTTEDRPAPRGLIKVQSLDEMKRRRGEKAARPVRERFAAELSAVANEKAAAKRKAKKDKRSASSSSLTFSSIAGGTTLE